MQTETETLYNTKFQIVKNHLRVYTYYLIEITSLPNRMYSLSTFGQQRTDVKISPKSTIERILGLGKITVLMLSTPRGP